MAPRLVVPSMHYRAPTAKGWLYCYDLISTARKFFSVCKSVYGLQYLLPLIDSVGLGDRLRLYRNATRFYYFIRTGSLVPLQYLRSGFMVCHLGVVSGKYALSAGTYVVLNTFLDGGFTCTLPSGQKKTIRGGYKAIIGRNAAPQAYKQYLGKASSNMHPRARVIVRSCAKNPVDHPNGGRTRGKTLIKTPWGRVARSSK